ncbi:site-specific integrase [Burkholderia arboris]|uniref:Site-specific integrase n=1 Tax=Burkholderia arboris TaxID=488730 RepID=A0ABZ3DWD8_9BURK
MRPRWHPAAPSVAVLTGDHRSRSDAGTGISASHQRQILGGFFRETAERITTRNPAHAEKLRRASPHWLRHTHATHTLEAGVELVIVRDNLHHASVAKTSAYLHGKER